MIPPRWMGWVLLFCMPALAGVKAMNAPALEGDISRDARLDILDVQRCINETLGAPCFSSVSDLDYDGMTDMDDVDLLVDSVLAAGGVIQPVRGQFVLPGSQEDSPLRVVALSQDGLRVEAGVSAQGRFLLPLWCGRGWSIQVFDTESAAWAGGLRFSYRGRGVFTLPLPPRSSGQTVDLGRLTLSPDGLTRFQGDVTGLLADMLPMYPEEMPGLEGLPYYAEALLEPLFEAISGGRKKRVCMKTHRWPRTPRPAWLRFPPKSSVPAWPMRTRMACRISWSASWPARVKR